jgi:hypothetical protein
MEIAPVDECYVDGSAPQGESGVETAESTAEDDDALIQLLGYS